MRGRHRKNACRGKFQSGDVNRHGTLRLPDVWLQALGFARQSDASQIARHQEVRKKQVEFFACRYGL